MPEGAFRKSAARQVDLSEGTLLKDAVFISGLLEALLIEVDALEFLIFDVFHKTFLRIVFASNIPFFCETVFTQPQIENFTLTPEVD
jgi:hypothetical protein